MANKNERQILLLVIVLVVGFILLGNFAPQAMEQLNKIGTDFNIKFFNKEPVNAAFGVVTLVIDQPVVQNEPETK